VPVSISDSEMLSLREVNRAEPPDLPSEISGWNANLFFDAPSNFGFDMMAPPTLRYQSPSNRFWADAWTTPRPSTATVQIRVPNFMITRLRNTMG
jgi:hypothetical protein